MRVTPFPDPLTAGAESVALPLPRPCASLPRLLQGQAPVTAIAVSGTGLFTPSQSISNEELVASFNTYVRRHNAAHASAIADGKAAALAESSVEFIVKASGIKNRFVIDKSGILDPDVMCPRIPERTNDQLSVLAEMAVTAARDALKAADRKPGDIDGVIVACSNLQRAYPAIAVEVQNALGIEGFGFDMNVACSSATFGLQAAADFVKAGHARAVLVCNPEICSGHLNFRDRDSHFIFGDVATAFIVEPANSAGGSNAWEIVATKLKTQFSNNIRNNFGFLNRTAPEGIGATDKLFVQEGRKVFKEVVPMVAELILGQLADNGIAPQNLNRMWLHQANLGMNELIARRVLGRDPLPSEAPNILDEYANTSSAGSVIAFHKFSADLPAGALGLLCSFGAGYSAGSVILRKLA
jgi:beta-ketodecanoyl-[acyl-carrier-protein] synthase